MQYENNRRAWNLLPGVGTPKHKRSALVVLQGFKVPMKRKFVFDINLKILRLKYAIPKFEMPAIKIVDFTSGQSWAVLPSKMVRRLETEFITLWRQFVCSGLFTPCYWREIQRLRKCQVILNRIVSPRFGVVLMKILFRTMRMMLKKVLNTQTDVTRCVTWRFDRAIQMPFFREK